jgi:hypothetical protein
MWFCINVEKMRKLDVVCIVNCNSVIVAMAVACCVVKSYRDVMNGRRRSSSSVGSV